MILDTSAIVAIALKEQGFEAVLEKLAGASHVGVGVPTVTETAIVLSSRLKRDARSLLSRFLLEDQFLQSRSATPTLDWPSRRGYDLERGVIRQP